MDFGSLGYDELSEVQVEECNLCALDPPISPVVTACGHCFCWPCMYNFLQGQAKPCPMCSTMLSNAVNVAPAFDTHGALVLRLPTAEEVDPDRSWDDDDDEMLDCSGTAAAFAPTPMRLEEEPSATRSSIVSEFKD